jgi:DNA mismatch repair protein MutL
VHPAKREVRFRSEGTVRRFVVEAITDCLSRFQESRKVDLPQSQSRAREVSDTPELVERESIPTPIAPGPGTPLGASPSTQEASTRSALPASSSPASTAGIVNPVMRATPTTEPEPHSLRQLTSSKDATEALADWRYIGRMGARLALLESTDGLVLLDLSHARQRVRFEAIIARIEREEDESSGAQSLLLPVSLELEPLLASTLEKHRAMLARGGFVVEPFGRHFYRIEAIPAWLDPGQAEALLRDTLEQLRETGGSANQRLASERFARLAAVFSTRRESTADAAAVMRLLSDLLNCEHPHTCPRGRPTMQLLTHAELNRRFESARK